MTGPQAPRYDPTGDLLWQADAECRNLGPALFFNWETNRREADRDEAIATCKRCDVQAECLAWALNNLDTLGDYGIWGGTTREQRRHLRHQRKAS